MRQVGGVNSNISYTWALSSVEETQYLRRNGDNILLIMDRYGVHISYKTLKLPRVNEIIVAGPPAYTQFT